jgi:oligopeptide/dipeptide ABC transporter ATP-binding protein
MKSVLSVRNLSVRFPGEPGVSAVDRINLDIKPGEVVGLIGESGSGKSSLASAILGVLDRSGVDADSIRLGDQELTSLDERQYRRLRGRDISMVFQEPLTALDPVFTIGSQIKAVLVRHQVASRRNAGAAAEKALRGMNLSDIPALLRSYPHQLSGGMRQRIIIAMAMACRPAVLLADEPTTALDVTTQALVLGSLLQLGRENATAILLITHDVAVAASICERIIVMKDGRFVEQAATATLLREPTHPYTRLLLEAVPSLHRRPFHTQPAVGDSVIELDRRQVSHPIRVEGKRRRLVAVRDVSLDIRAGEIHALVGESGSGKSTLAQSLVGLKPACSGSLLMYGKKIANGDASAWSSVRRHVQLVFQDPRGSLSPRRTVEQSLLEPLDHFRIDTPEGRSNRVSKVLERVELEPATASRHPHELSGGQRQRVALARALISEPDLIVADEPLSSLDVSIQSKIIRLLLRLRHELGFAVLIVSHDLAVVRQLADRVSVMYLGRIVESAPAETLFKKPAHPYTRSLLSAVPEPGQPFPTSITAATSHADEPPSLLTPPPGCVFHTRCPDVMSQCLQVDPPECRLDTDPEKFRSHKVHCLLYENNL